MSTFNELEMELIEYANPQKLGYKILASLTEQLYKSNPKKYNTFIRTFYMQVAERNNDEILAASIVCTWLACSAYKNREAFELLDNIKVTHIYRAHISSEMKYKTLTFEMDDAALHLVQTIFLELAILNDTSYTKNTIGNRTYIEKEPNTGLDDLHKLKLITTLLIYKERYLTPDIIKDVNTVLESLDLKNLPVEELVKIMALHEHLNKPILTNIATLLYTEEKFELIISTAQALGVVSNPDYWVQNLPSSTSQLNKSNTTTELPNFN